MPRLTVPACLIALALCLGFIAAPCAAEGTEAKQARPDSLPRPRYSLVVLPYAYYTPETKIAFGAGGVYSFRFAAYPDGRPSSAKVAATYTQRKQVILAFEPELYLQKERYYYTGFYGYYRYPDKFWGVGSNTPDGAEETYRSNDFESSTSVQCQIVPGIYAGALFRCQFMSVDDMAPHGALRAGGVVGSTGGWATGLGAIVSYDTRNHVYEPSKGFYNQCSLVSFGSALKSDYIFNVLTIDLRMYRGLFRSHVIAVQTYDTFISGKAPFQMLGELGGSYSMRGFYRGRYRDNDLMTAQVEYRVPVWWRFGAVGFAGAGDVGSGVRHFRINRLKTSIGCGIRFVFDTKEKINARLDVGVGSGDNVGVYAMVLEAF